MNADTLNSDHFLIEPTDSDVEKANNKKIAHIASSCCLVKAAEGWRYAIVEWAFTFDLELSCGSLSMLPDPSENWVYPSNTSASLWS